MRHVRRRRTIRRPHRSRPKRRFSRKKFSRISTLTLRRPGVICPDRYRLKLRQIDTATTSLTAATGTNYKLISYPANTLYSLNVATAIPGYDALALLYESYRVLGVAIKVRFSNLSVSATGGLTPVVVGIIPTNSAPSISGAATLASFSGNPYARTKVIQSVNQGEVMLKAFISTKKMTGSNYSSTDLQYSGTFAGAGPATLALWYWDVYCYVQDAQTSFTGGTLKCPISVELTIYVECFDRINLLD